ncbi:MAG: LysM peptidoglycan-binding domain-containing protein [Patescibacteria group bacterium]
MDFNSNSQKQSVDSINSPIHKENRIKINFLKVWGGIRSVLIYLSEPALFVAFKAVKYLKTQGRFFDFQRIFAFLNKKQLVWVVVAVLMFISFNENINLNPSEQNKNIFPILAVIKSNKIDNKILTTEENITNAEKNNADIQPSFKMAAVLSDTAPITETPDNSATALGGGALFNPNADDYEADYSLMRVEIENYIVQSGDTISSIAEKFNITPKTIAWENKLTLNTTLKVGKELKILPISGLTHKVKSGDNVVKIAKLYRTNPEDIMDFNDLGNESDIFVGDTLIIPEGTPPPPPAPRPIVKKYADKTEALNVQDFSKPEGNNCHIFYPGHCTWYIAKKRCIPWTGHAKSWLANAKTLGFPTGKTPALGAIIATKESWWGHVGLVEAFDDQTVTFSEMNHLGRWKTSRRTLSLTDKRITGYIY